MVPEGYHPRPVFPAGDFFSASKLSGLRSPETPNYMDLEADFDEVPPQNRFPLEIPAP